MTRRRHPRSCKRFSCDLPGRTVAGLERAHPSTSVPRLEVRPQSKASRPSYQRRRPSRVPSDAVRLSATMMLSRRTRFSRSSSRMVSRGLELVAVEWWRGDEFEVNVFWRRYIVSGFCRPRFSSVMLSRSVFLIFEDVLINHDRIRFQRFGLWTDPPRYVRSPRRRSRFSATVEEGKLPRLTRLPSRRLCEQRSRCRKASAGAARAPKGSSPLSRRTSGWMRPCSRGLSVPAQTWAATLCWPVRRAARPCRRVDTPGAAGSESGGGGTAPTAGRPRRGRGGAG